MWQNALLLSHLKRQTATDITINTISSYQKTEDTRIPGCNIREMSIDETNNRETHTLPYNRVRNPYYSEASYY